VNIKDTIRVINDMQAAGVIGRYAIGGAVAANFYIDPRMTVDIDIFVALDPPPGQLIASPQPIYDYLVRRRGFPEKGDYIVISPEWPVQFLPVGDPLLKEALSEAVEKDLDGVITRIFKAEHLAAIALSLGRPKDRDRLGAFLEARALDEGAFSGIIDRHGLTGKWESFRTKFLG
jgi:hypothetical protein